MHLNRPTGKRAYTLQRHPRRATAKGRPLQPERSPRFARRCGLPCARFSGSPSFPARLKTTRTAMPPTPRLNADFCWECPACRRPFLRPDQAAHCPCPKPKRVRRHHRPLGPLRRTSIWDGHPVALTGWLEAEQAELTVPHRTEDGTVTATAWRFCASRDALEPTGQHAHVPAA